MTKAQIREVMRQAIDPHKLCRVLLQYEENYYYYFPLIVSDRLFLGAEEDDFILDGYAIRRFRDVAKAEIKDDKCLEIAASEGILDQLAAPDVDVTDWRSAMASLQKIGKNVIVQREDLDKDDEEFAIGRIVRVLKQKALFRHFDADGVWSEDLLEIPYSQISSIIFGARYVDIFSKYLPPIPEARA